MSATLVKPGSVVCVLVNWNGWQDTIACLRSLAAQDYPHLHTLIVDNASPNDSLARLAEALPELGPQFELVAAPSNSGFAYGCNIGIRIALERGADFVWLLNNDTVAPPDTLTKLIAAAQTPAIGIVGTVLRYMHEPTRIQAWGGGRVLRWMGYTRHFLAPAPLGPDSFLTFASVLIRQQVFTTAGLLDEGFFMYSEDADLCFRARSSGWQLTVAADTSVLHREGGSGGPRRNPRTDRTVTYSGLRFLRRHGRPVPIAMVLFVLSRLGRRLPRADFAAVRAVLAGVADWWQRRRQTAVVPNPGDTPS